MGTGHPVRPDPCFETVPRAVPASTERIRVVEVLATGTSGGAQEHLFGLVSDAGVHALIEHLFGCLELCRGRGLT